MPFCTSTKVVSKQGFFLYMPNMTQLSRSEWDPIDCVTYPAGFWFFHSLPVVNLELDDPAQLSLD